MMYNTNMTKPSKFTGEMYGTKVSVEYENSDISLDEVMDAFETLLTGMGYHPDALKQWIIERAEEYKEEDNQSEDDEIDNEDYSSTYKESLVEHVINKLNEIEVDGDTMQYIVEQVGLDEQLAIQLATLYPDIVEEHIQELKEEGILKDKDDFEPHVSDNFQIGPNGAYEHYEYNDEEEIQKALKHFIKTMKATKK